jgi:WbqC-like protein family
MKLGIMQPYFFPYLGHFALIAAVDEWVVFDITQYTRKSWLSRNRILRPAGGWTYVSVPLKNSSTHIKTYEARVADIAKAQQHVRGKLSHYKRRAPNYASVCDVVDAAFAGAADDSLVALDVSALRTVCEYLRLPFRYRVCSQLAIEYPDHLRAGEWAPWIAAKLSADVYVNPISGRPLFHQPDFGRRRIELQFLDYAPVVYETPGYTFQEDLSILDVLMWNDPGAIVRAIGTNTSLITAQA